MASQPLPIPEQQTRPALEYPASLSKGRALSSRIPHYWHLLSLDAPTVATLWAWSFARVFHITLSASPLLLLFAGTWLLYVGDRILDGYRQNPGGLRPRHLFYIRNRASVLAAAIPVTALLAWLVCAHMSVDARRADTLLIAFAAAYFLLVHLRRAGIDRWLPKELIVALVFAAAAVVPVWTRLGTDAAPHSATPQTFILAAIDTLFAAICWINCIAIEKWEQPPHPLRLISNTTIRSRLSLVDPIQISDSTTRWGQRRLRAVCLGITAAAIAAAVVLVYFAQFRAATLCAAAALSAVLLFALDRSTLPAQQLRIAADAALLTPLLLLIR